jgi:hypothetical protein
MSSNSSSARAPMISARFGRSPLMRCVSLA